MGIGGFIYISIYGYRFYVDIDIYVNSDVCVDIYIYGYRCIDRYRYIHRYIFVYISN